MPATCPKCYQPNREAAQFCSTCGAALILGNRYRVLRIAGSGGFSVVYQVEDLRLPGKTWAAKEMSDDRILDPREKQEAITSFQHEAELLSRLSHPNILGVIDSFQQGSKHYIISEFVEGLTLSDLLARRGALTESEVRDVLGQLCSALQYLHNRVPPVIFRDLKPHNVMIDRNGQVRLIDFGIARMFRPGKTQDTTLLGTPGYAPPEQYGQGQTDVRSDVYALGVTAYQMLTNCDPSSNPYHLPPVRSLAPGISPGLEQAITRCLQIRPQDRWQSIAELSAALQAGKPVGVPAGARGEPTLANPYVYRQSPGITPQPAHRPTTRLLMAAATLTNGQLAAILGGFVLLVALAVWVLGPIIQREAPWFWENVPGFCIAGPLAYAATRKRWAAGVTQAAVTIVGWLTWALRSPGLPMDWGGFLVATLLSAAAVEGMMWATPKVVGRRGPDAWQREIGWFALSAMVTAVVFYAILAGPSTVLRFGLLIGALFVGALGWFLGDLVNQAVQLRKGGMRRTLRP